MRRAEIERLLPAVFQLALRQAAEAGSAPPLLDGLLEAMAALHTSVEQQIESVARTFDPRVCPEPFVALLSRWLARAVHIGRERGTHDALRALLVCATGLSEIAIEEGTCAGGEPRAFHLTIRVPAAAAPHVALLHALIAGQKPAHVTYELCVRPGGEP